MKFSEEMFGLLSSKAMKVRKIEVFLLNPSLSSRLLSSLSITNVSNSSKLSMAWSMLLADGGAEYDPIYHDSDGQKSPQNHASGFNETPKAHWLLWQSATWTTS